MTDQEVLQALKDEFHVSSGSEICSAAMTNVLQGHESDKDWIKANFSELVERIQLEAYYIYLDSEKPAAIKSMRNVLGAELGSTPSKSEFFDLLESNFWALDKFFLSLTQGRRTRAGKAFEQVIRVLFNVLGYPYTSQAVINGKPDFLLPSIVHFRKNAMDCIIFTVKRTLRERWRQITTEGTQGHQFFLATIDEGVASRDLSEMLKSRIYLVVPEKIRQKFYKKVVNVISFEGFFLKHLDPAMKRWRSDGVIL